MKTLIIDDERLARSELKAMLAPFPQLDIVGEAKNADQAIMMIQQLQPDLLFLDIQMPGKNGFELLEALETVPQVIFVTAYDQYAIKAFETSAIDYLLKPVEQQRLQSAIAKLPLVNTHETAYNTTESADNNELEEPLKLSDKVFLKDGDNCWFVELEKVCALESIGNYTRVYFEQHKPLIRRSLLQLEKRLSEKDFFRANRQTMINLHHLTNVEPSVADGLDIEMSNGMTIEMSRRQAQQFKKLKSF